MANHIVAESEQFKTIYSTMHQVNSLLIAVEQSGIEMDSGDVLAAIAGIKALAFVASETLDKLGDLEVLNG